MKRLLGVLIVSMGAFMVGVPEAFAADHIVGPNAEPGDLAAALGVATDGDTIRLLGGHFDGPIAIDRSVALIGEGWPVIDGGGTGTVVTVSAPDVTIQGCVIQNSGLSLEAENAGVTVEADRVVIEGNRIENVLFGVYLKQAERCQVRENRIIGNAELSASRRGDLVRAWYSKHVQIENNILEQGRDLIVWFSDHSTVRGNTVSDARYGVHLMYDSDCEVSNNIFLNNSVGAYLMYSRRLVIANNTIAYNRGPSGFGVGLKDLDDIRLEGNLIVDNRVGIFVDNAPRDIDSHIEYENNVIAYNDQGMRLNASTERTRIAANSFMDNYEDVAVPGGERAPNIAWVGNYWSDYAGYDADADGTGELPYRSEKLFEDVIDRYPKLRLFIYSPALQAMDLAAKVFPVVRPRPKLVDEAPMMQPHWPSGPPVVEKRSAVSLGVMSLLLIGLGLIVGLRTGLGGTVSNGRLRADREEVS